MSVHDCCHLCLCAQNSHLHPQDLAKLLEIEGLECELEALRLESKINMYLRGAVEVSLKPKSEFPWTQDLWGQASFVSLTVRCLGEGSQRPWGMWSRTG